MSEKTGLILVVPADREIALQIHRLAIDEDGEMPLDRMQALVGGYVERVRAQGPLSRGTAWVNEEGLLKGLPVNRRLTALMMQTLVGDGFVELDDKRNREMLREVGMGAMLDQLGFEDPSQDDAPVELPA